MKLACVICGGKLLAKHAKVVVGEETFRRVYHVDCYTQVCRPLLDALLAQAKAIQQRLTEREAS